MKKNLEVVVDLRLSVNQDWYIAFKTNIAIFVEFIDVDFRSKGVRFQTDTSRKTEFKVLPSFPGTTF